MFEAKENGYSLESYWRIVEADPDQKYEFSEGNVRLMTGGTSWHAQIASRINRLLGNALEDSECNVYTSDAAVLLNDLHVYYPDVSVSCDPIDWTSKRGLLSPSVIVEVLSPSTEKTDRGEKLKAYQNFPTIQEILYVDSRQRYIEHFHRVEAHQWKLFIYTEPDDVVKMESVGVELKLREIYHKVHLELEENA